MKNRTYLLISLAIIILGSLIGFYCTNLLCSDLSNMFYGVNDYYFISSIPLSMIFLDFVVGFIYVFRVYKNKENIKSLTKLYLIYYIVFSLIGIVSSILTGTIVYHSFTSIYPFNGYTILMLIVNSLIFIASIYLLIFTKNLKDGKKSKKGFLYVIYNMVLVLFLLISFDKFGGLLWSVSFTNLRTFGLTFSYYLYLLVPFVILINVLLYRMDLYKKANTFKIINISTLFSGIVLGIVVMILGYKNPQFISNISIFLPIERLATMPIHTIFEFVCIIIYNGYLLIYSILKSKRAN